jgi:hypothetical protein
MRIQFSGKPGALISLSRLLTLANAGLCIAGCSATTSSQSPVNKAPDFPDIITVERGGFTPEGIEDDYVEKVFVPNP